MLFISGGDSGPGLGLELLALTLLELCRLRPLRNRARWKLIKLAAAGEFGMPIHSPPGLLARPVMKLLESFETCGVLRMTSSLSLSIKSSSDDELLSLSESNIFTLLTELERPGRSLFGIVDQRPDMLLGESRTVLPKLLLCGI
jgi:hypothetical protein